MADQRSRYDKLLQTADAAAFDHRWPKALELYSQALEAISDQAQETAGFLLRVNRAGDQAALEGQWDEAEQFYHLAMSADGANRDARAAIDRLNQVRAIDLAVQETMANGDSLLAAGEYQQALNNYTEALDNAGHAGILRYHVQLESKRNQARELAVILVQIRDAVEQANQLHRDGKPSEALERLDALLRQLPQGEPYSTMAGDVVQMRERMKGDVDADDLYQQAHQALRDENYELTIEWAQAVQPTSHRYRDAQALLAQAQTVQRHYIDPTLQNAEQALNEQRWSDAFAELDRLRADYPKNPGWQRLWLRAGMAHGEHALDQGRRLNRDQQFEEARQAFEQAQRALEQVLEIYPTHAGAPVLRNEAVDLVEIAVDETQAEADWVVGRRAEAKAALERARQRIEEAKARGRNYATVAAVVGSMLAALVEEIERIEREGGSLNNGERLLKEHRLGDAAQQFQQTLNALLPEHQRWAADGLSRTEQQIKQFDSFMLKANEAANAAARVEHLQRAYDLWPGGHDVTALLIDTLSDASEAALVNKDQRIAAEYIQRALVLEEDNVRAKLLSSRISDEPQIEASLKQSEGELTKLAASPDTRSTDFEPILMRLEEDQRRAASYRDLKHRVDTQIDSASHLQEHWRAYEVGSRASLKAGQWESGLELLTVDLAAMSRPPAALEQHQARWQQAVAELEDTRQFASAQWRAAEAAYAASPAQGGAGGVLDSLGQLRARLEQLDATASSMHAAAPSDLAAVWDRLEDLEKRANILHKSLRAPSAINGVLGLREALQTWPNDTVLQEALRVLESKAAAEGDQMLWQVDFEIAAGNLDAALNLLKQARDLRPQDAAIASRYAQLQRRRRLQEELATVQLDIDSKIATGSMSAAQQAVRRGLDLFLDPDNELPEDTRNALTELVRSGAGATMLADPKQWTEAQSLQKTIETTAPQNWSAMQAALLVNEWLRLARDQALRGVIASSTELGDLIDAYRAATEYIKQHPVRDTEEGKEAARLIVEVRTRLLNRANESADTRLQRAEAALASGEFKIAIENLDAIEPEFYAEIRRNFPNLLYLNTEVTSRLDRATELRQEALRVGELYSTSKASLDLAEQHFFDGATKEAETALQSLLPLDELPQIARRAKILLGQVKEAEAQAANDQLLQALTQLEIRSIAATSADQLQSVLDNLAKLSSQRSLSMVSREQMEDYRRIVADTSQRQQDLQGGGAWEESANHALEVGEYSNAFKAATGALKRIKQGENQAALAEMLRNVEPLAELENGLLQHRKDASDFAGQGRYGEAVQKWRQALDTVERLISDMRRLAKPPSVAAFQRIEGFRDEFEVKRDVARAGAALARARRLWDEKGDWSMAQDEIDQAVEIAKTTPQAKELAKDAERFRQTVARQLEKEKVLGLHLRKANLALAAGELNEAAIEIEAALAQDHQHVSANDLQKKLESTYKAKAILDNAQKKMNAGDYDAAQALVNTVLNGVLPDYPDAVALNEQIGSGRAANDALKEAEPLAKGNDFKEAHAALQRALKLGADSERLRIVQSEVLRMEAQWKAETVNPIKTRLLDQEYAAAYGQCKSALNQVASDSFRAELEVLLAGIVGEWTNSELSAIRGLLQRADETEGEAKTRGLLERADETEGEANLKEAFAKLEFLSTLEPSPAPQQRRIVSDLLVQANQRVFKTRLDDVRELVDRQQWDAAMMMISEIHEEADQLRLGVVVKEAFLLELDIKEQQRLDDEQKTMFERTARMADATKLWESLTSRRDLERVATLASKVLEIPQCRDDAEALALRDEAERALQSYDETSSALKRSRERLNQGQFSEAATALRLVSVSVVLQADYDRQRAIADHLRQAERSQREKQWHLALQEYQQALALDSTLLTLIENDIDRCRQRLMDQVIAGAEASLGMTPPNVDHARRLLNQAKDEQWVQVTHQKAVDQLLNWCRALELVDQAAVIAQDESGDLDAATKLLDEARLLMPAEQSSKNIQSWQELVKALQHRNAGRIEAAVQSLRRVEPPVADMALARGLRTELNQAQDLGAAVGTAQSNVQEAMRAQPPRHSEAVDVVAALIAQSGRDVRARQLQEELGTRLLEMLKEYQRTDRFDNAIEVGASLLRLLPDDQVVQETVEALPQERDRRLQESLTLASEALRANRLSDAERACQAALIIAGASPDAGVSRLGQQLADKRAMLGSADELLDRSRLAARNLDWRAAVTAMQNARATAPGYEPVEVATSELIGQVVRAGTTVLHAGDFSQALLLCDLAAQLASSDPKVVALRQDIEQQRRTYLSECTQELQTYLDRWEIDKATAVVNQALVAAPGDVQWSEKQREIQKLTERSDTVEKQFAAGVAALRKRDYSDAQTAFQTANNAAKPVGLHEISLWQEYLQNMTEATAIVTDSRWEQLEQAEALLARAAIVLQPDSREKLPAIARDLYQWRRQAAWDAQQLHEIAGRMNRIHNQHKAELDGRNFGRAFELFEQLEGLQRDYLRRHGQPQPAPATFGSGAKEESGRKVREEQPQPARQQVKSSADQQLKMKDSPRTAPSSSAEQPPLSSPPSVVSQPTEADKSSLAEDPAPDAAKDSGVEHPEATSEYPRPTSHIPSVSEAQEQPSNLSAERNDDDTTTIKVATPQSGPDAAADSVDDDSSQDSEGEEDSSEEATMTWDISGFSLATYAEEN